MNAPVADQLRQEIDFLATALGETIRETGGERAFALVELIRHQSRGRRTGSTVADDRIKQLIADLNESEMRVAIRAFTVFLDLLNLAEDRQRIRVLRQRADNAYPDPRRESIRAAVAKLKDAGVSPEHAQKLIDQLHVELVFTAHPTEAKRRSVRQKLRTIRELLTERAANIGPEQQAIIDGRIRSEIAKLWQTNFIRPWRPSVLQEVARGLSFKPVLWETVPRIAQDLTDALQESYGEEVRASKPSITFGSWIGGDRDGHPGVTADVTEETFAWLRREAIAFHLSACDALSDSLSISQRQVDLGSELPAKIEAAKQSWPELNERLAPLPPDELFRQWLQVIRWRLEQTLPAQKDTTVGQSASFQSACDLASDVSVLKDAISSVAGCRHCANEVTAWQTQINTFGLHLARLDVRQNAKVNRQVLDEMLRDVGQCEDFIALDEPSKCELLQSSLDQPQSIEVERLSPEAQETLQLFQTLHRVCDQYSRAAIGTYVISMTSQPSDALAVLWLWKQTDSGNQPCIPIVPLLETIDDLSHGPDILEGMLAIPAYREHLRGHADRQLIMLGYSDSTKDGGYLSACWSLHQAQRNLVAVAGNHEVDVTFFHGRGGSLGRGGGPAARSILSLPEGTFHGELRLTEQGEVLADRYDDPQIAYRHLEQVLWSSLLAANKSNDATEQWYDMMDRLADRSFKAYRELLEQPSFVNYFRRATPISEVEQLPIGSRPSRRKPDGGLADLRAIPWVFSWTQSRCLIPAWYGLGSAMASLMEDPGSMSTLRNMYEQWPFFRGLIDNAELALAKSDADIADEYANLATEDDSLRAISEKIKEELGTARSAVLSLTQGEELLDGIAWLRESIRVRNRYIDPLNLIQVELLRRGRQEDPAIEEEELRHLSRLSINGIASGMRTSG